LPHDVIAGINYRLEFKFFQFRNSYSTNSARNVDVYRVLQ
jgi:hypothetical protein